jgi:hypothetical protein
VGKLYKARDLKRKKNKNEAEHGTLFQPVYNIKKEKEREGEREKR